MTARRRLALIACLAVVLILAVAAPVLAASPSPTMGQGTDPRSSGQGPGLMGDPLFAILAVVAIGLGTVAATLVWVKLTGGREG